MTETESTQRGLPKWVTIAVLAAAVIGGGIFVWYNFAGPNVDRSTMAASLPDGVRPFYGVNPVYGKRGDSEFARYGNETWIFYKLQDLDRVALHAIADMGFAEQIKLTQEQRSALQKLTWGIQLSPEERKKVEAMFADCRKAAAEGPGAIALANGGMLDGIDEIARKHSRDANSATAERQKQISGILKPEQIAEGKTWMEQQMGSQRWMPAVPPRPGAGRASMGNGRRNSSFTESLRQWAAQPSSRPSVAPSPRAAN